jgi:hypothetical protein
LAILITAVAAFAAVAYYREVGRRLELEDELARLEQAAEISNKDLGKERSVRIAAQQQTIEEHARRLVADSRLVRQQSHSLSLLLAAEAIESLRRNGLPVADWAVRNLRETIHAVRSSDANNDSQPDLGRLLEAAAQLAGRTMTPAERQQYAIQGG